MKREDVLAWLSSLTDKQFVDFFYDAVKGRDTSDFEGEEGHLVLADTCQAPDEERETVFLALPDVNEYPQGWMDDSPICQTGECLACRSTVRSIAKKAVCPICGEKVYCT